MKDETLSLLDWLSQSARDALMSTKVAATVSAATMTTGLGTIYKWIPENIGWLASTAGFILTCILAYSAWQREKREVAKSKREELRLEIDKRLAEKELKTEINNS